MNKDETLSKLFHDLNSCTASLKVGFSTIRNRLDREHEKVEEVIQLTDESISKLNILWNKLLDELKKKEEK